MCAGGSGGGGDKASAHAVHVDPCSIAAMEVYKLVQVLRKKVRVDEAVFILPSFPERHDHCHALCTSANSPYKICDVESIDMQQTHINVVC